ncbi:unnamed protein product [Rotaria sp. Silwood2]|nr:unnamed protein product [Rotaria sp. Silwood2]CAF3220264.1 unnamed protein product [Rotaria sp. Silwood2]CAF3468373.1 unnamed protein product [Rotaria sp. Silwood2]CAF4286035.1 unnamed protein product [Rotaria sp. Silwood2]
MSLTIRLYKSRKFIISFLIIIILLDSFVIFQSLNNYFDSIKQSNVHLPRQASQLDSSFIQRAIIVYYPSHQESHYFPEIRWLYHSWIEMMKYESKNWRTDLIIYTGEYPLSFQQLGCILNQIRINNTEQPQCRVFLYLRLSKREISPLTQQQTILTNQGKKELFNINTQRSIQLYKQIKQYEYIDSVNIIAESYPTFEYYDFILKTDIDVFITTQFAKYVPLTNVTLLVGRGGYSTKFNTRRLGRIARDMNWEYQNMTNIGSTW